MRGNNPMLTSKLHVMLNISVPCWWFSRDFYNRDSFDEMIEMRGVGCCCLCLLLWNLLSSFLGVLWRCGGFLWHWWFDFFGLKFFLSGTCWFHLCILLCSCWLGISGDRLYQFSEQLELDLLDAWVKTWWCWCLQRKLLTLYLLWCVCAVHWGLWCMGWQL